MNRRLALLIWLVAAPAFAQPPAPPPPPPATQQTLGDNLFREREPEEGDEDIAAGRVEPPPPQAPAAPPVATKPEPGTRSSAAYDQRVVESFQAAERFQGPLDGGWTFSTRNGWSYGLQFADHAGKLEGAWRDLRRPGTLGASGFVDVLERSPTIVRLRFQPTGDMPITLVLRPSTERGWSGEAWRGDEEFTFVLKRDAP